MAPRRLQDAPRRPQAGPRAPQMASERVDKNPRWHQDALRQPNRAQDGRRTSQDGSQTRQDGSKTDPKRPKMAPGQPKIAPRRFPTDQASLEADATKLPMTLIAMTIVTNIIFPSTSGQVCGSLNEKYSDPSQRARRLGIPRTGPCSKGAYTGAGHQAALPRNFVEEAG